MIPDIGRPDRQHTDLVLVPQPLYPVPEIGAKGPSDRSHRLRRLLVVALITAVLGSLLWYWLWPSPPELSYKLAMIDRGPITSVVTATGTVNPITSVLVGSQVSGIVRTLFADFNSVVTEGQILAQIDPVPFQARVDQARANLTTARGNLNKATAALALRQLELDRAAALRPQGFIAQSDLDLARANHRDAAAQIEVAEGQVHQAEAALANAKFDLQRTKIYSPVNGIVVSRNVDLGQTVIASLQAPTLFVIAQDLARMQVEANVSEADIAGINEGKPAEFTVDAYPGEPFPGTVVQVRNAPISIQNVVTYNVVIAVDNRDLKLKPGMTANVSIVTAQKDQVVRIPNAALRFKMPGAPPARKKATVWVMDPPGQPRPITIRAGILDSSFTEMLEGEVREGDPVIVGIEMPDEAEQKALPPGFGVGPRVR